MVQRYDKKGRQLYYWTVKNAPVYSFNNIICHLTLEVTAATVGLAYSKMLNYVKFNILHAESFAINVHFDKNLINKGRMIL